MADIYIRNFIPEDIPQITAVQEAYRQAYPHASVVPGEAYLSPGFEGGKNIFCAFDGKGMLQGYAPVFPVLIEAPNLPHTVWTEVKADPESDSLPEVKEALFERVLKRAKEVTSTVAGHAVQVTFQYHPTETSSIEFVTSRGCAYSESVFRLRRDLAEELPVVHAPESIEIRGWHMDSEGEQQAYVRARNEAFPEAPVSLADWQSFLTSPAWKEGTNITAFDGPEVVGCVTAYWDEFISQQAGCRAGYTEFIFVRAQWQRGGIASAMITQALAFLKEHGREAAFLEVKASNEKALDLYTRLGYRRVDETRFYVLRL
jgi:ribosomal protein S18 acetylase RimI-like enzyme